MAWVVDVGAIGVGTTAVGAAAGAVDDAIVAPNTSTSTANRGAWLSLRECACCVSNLQKYIDIYLELLLPHRLGAHEEPRVIAFPALVLPAAVHWCVMWYEP